LTIDPDYEWAREESNPESSLCKSDVLTIVEPFLHFSASAFCDERLREEQKGLFDYGPIF
jgi:hypothetical protein